MENAVRLSLVVFIITVVSVQNGRKHYNFVPDLLWWWFDDDELMLNVLRCHLTY